MLSNTIKQFIQSVFIGSLLTTSLFSIASAQVTDTIDQVASSCVTLTKNMTIGAKDSTSDGQVSDLQFFLSDKGYLKTDPTGYFGQATLSAAKAFQGDNGITPNGLVGPLTRGKVSSVSCGGQEPTSTNTGSTGGSQTGGSQTSGQNTPQTVPVTLPQVNLQFSGTNADDQPVTIVGGTITNINPMYGRTWSWTSRGASSISARYVVSGQNCVAASQYGGALVENNWQPWVGVSASGDRFNGSNVRKLGPTYYGCTIDATFTGRNTSGDTSVSTVKAVFMDKPVMTTSPTPQGTTYCELNRQYAFPVSPYANECRCPSGSTVADIDPRVTTNAVTENGVPIIGVHRFSCVPNAPSPSPTPTPSPMPFTPIPVISSFSISPSGFVIEPGVVVGATFRWMTENTTDADKVRATCTNSTTGATSFTVDGASTDAKVIQLSSDKAGLHTCVARIARNGESVGAPLSATFSVSVKSSTAVSCTEGKTKVNGACVPVASAPACDGVSSIRNRDGACINSLNCADWIGTSCMRAGPTTSCPVGFTLKGSGVSAYCGL